MDTSKTQFKGCQDWLANTETVIGLMGNSKMAGIKTSFLEKNGLRQATSFATNTRNSPQRNYLCRVYHLVEPCFHYMLWLPSTLTKTMNDLIFPPPSPLVQWSRLWWQFTQNTPRKTLNKNTVAAKHAIEE